jgi:hypothetical protein
MVKTLNKNNVFRFYQCKMHVENLNSRGKIALYYYYRESGRYRTRTCDLQCVILTL